MGTIASGQGTCSNELAPSRTSAPARRGSSRSPVRARPRACPERRASPAHERDARGAQPDAAVTREPRATSPSAARFANVRSRPAGTARVARAWIGRTRAGPSCSSMHERARAARRESVVGASTTANVARRARRTSGTRVHGPAVPSAGPVRECASAPRSRRGRTKEHTRRRARARPTESPAGTPARRCRRGCRGGWPRLFRP